MLTTSNNGDNINAEIPNMECEVICMRIAYPRLTAEVARRGIKKSAIAEALGISGRSLYNKMSGAVPFTWPETCMIQHRFFPDMEKDDLFSKE